jgi:hypothetical protein
MKSYCYRLLEGCLNEDHPVTNCAEHYYDHDFNLGLYFWGYHPPAPERANKYFRDAIKQYRDGSYTQAAETLGRMIHLLEDMGVPAHCLLDAHPVGYGYNDPDWYETTYIPNYHVSTSYVEADPGVCSSLDSLFNHLCDISDNYDSNSEDGEDPNSGVDRSNGFDDTEGAIMANACYKGAIAHVPPLMALFFKAVRPCAYFKTPWSYDTAISGPKGIDYDVHVRWRDPNTGYYYDVPDGTVKIYYSYDPDPNKTSAYQLKKTIHPGDANGHYKCNITEYTNHPGLWAIAEAYDGAWMNAQRIFRWIKIDTTPPVIENVSK